MMRIKSGSRGQNETETLFFQKEITKLPRKYQEVIVLRYFEKKQIKEVSEILGKKEGTVKSLLHRGLKELAKIVPPNQN